MDKVSYWRTSLGKEETQGVVDAISKEYISQGPFIAEFEDQLAKALDIPYVILTPSGSCALLIALMALDVGPGDEVIVPNRTFIATAHAPLVLGAKVVLADVLPDIPNMDVSQIREKITPRTKTIIPVHRNGRAVDMEELNNIAKEYRLPVIEDACQALFSRNAIGYLGTQSKIGCFSLGVTKLITTGQGGVVVTRDKEIYDRLRSLQNQGDSANANEFDNGMGFNFKYTSIMAAIGKAQLARVPDRIAHLKAIYAKYEAGLSEFPFIKLIPVNVTHGELPLWVEAMSKERDMLRKFLSSKGIDTIELRPNLSLSPHLQNTGDSSGSTVFQDQGMGLPCGPDQPLENVDRVLETLCLYHKQR